MPKLNLEDESELDEARREELAREAYEEAVAEERRRRRNERDDDTMMWRRDQ